MSRGAIGEGAFIRNCKLSIQDVGIMPVRVARRMLDESHYGKCGYHGAPFIASVCNLIFIGWGFLNVIEFASSVFAGLEDVFRSRFWIGGYPERLFAMLSFFYCKPGFLMAFWWFFRLEKYGFIYKFRIFFVNLGRWAFYRAPVSFSKWLLPFAVIFGALIFHFLVLFRVYSLKFPQILIGQ